MVINNFSPGHGSIIGFYENIQYHDKIQDITIQLSNKKIVGEHGRLVTCMYWIVDKDFSLSSLNINNAFYATNISGVTPGAILLNSSNNVYWPAFVHTNLLTENIATSVKFTNFTQYKDSNNAYHNSDKNYGKNYKIDGSRIFIAIVSNDGNGEILSHTETSYQDLNTHYLALPLSNFGTFYVKDGLIDTASSSFRSVSDIGSIMCKTNSLHENDDITPDEGTDKSKPNKIRCSKICYRTWSDPKESITINNTSFNNKYLLSYLDGGENFSDVSINEVKITGSNDSELDKRSNSYYAKTHIINSDNNIVNKFYIPEGRLSDVIYDQPANDEVIRWVFKRSRLKFTIPAYDKKTIIGLQIKTGVHSFEKNGSESIYKNKITKITVDANTSIDLVICPRDEGILDNMPFEVVLKRKFYNTSDVDRNWSTPTTYKFHTYQKPTIDIAYPKIIRNNSTGEGFRYAKILANNNYSSFTEDDALLNKHVCDALTVMFGVPKNDESNIPIFVRYYLAEYRYGRNGYISKSHPNILEKDLQLANYQNNANSYVTIINGNITNTYTKINNNTWKITRTNNNTGEITNESITVSDHEVFEFIILSGNGILVNNISTLQDLYRSNDSSDYTSLDEILNNSNNKMKTAQVTNIFINDGRPVLISGRFSKGDLKSIGENYKLWTYKTWGNVYSSDSAGSNLDNKLSDFERNYNNPINNPENDVNKYNNDIPVKNSWSQIVCEKSDSDSNLVYVNKAENPFSELWDHNGQVQIDKEYALRTYGKWLNDDDTFVRDSNGRIDLKMFKIPIVKDILFRAGYIYLLRARSFHGAVAGAISEKYSRINNGHIIYGKPNTGFYDYEGSTYHAVEPISNTIGNNTYKTINYPDDNAVYGDEKPFKGWQGPDDGTSGIPLPKEYNYYSNSTTINNNLTINKINQTYPGFSPVDYTIFEVVSPFVSKSNMIGIHPSTSEIGANQWITFSYRHLQKNIGSIDSYAFVNNETKNKYFGNKPSGIDNTMTRIMHMYHSCIVDILKKYENVRNEYVGKVGECHQSNNTFSEKLTLNITPISTLNTNINSNKYDYKNTLNVPHVIDVNDANCNALIKEFINSDKNNLVNKNFYENSLCGLKYFYDYRAGQGGDFSSQDTSKWQEADIVWRSPKNGITGLLQDENHPLGNSYRWQVVINAMSNANSEIQIENKNVPSTPISNNSNYILNLNNIDKTYHTNYNSDKAAGIDKTLQTKYYYEDSQDYKPNEITDISNNASHRFTINEFAGKTDDSPELAESPGSPVFYTTYSLNKNKDSQQDIHAQNDKYFRFFTNLEQEKSYGKLYMRIPKSQDCENGSILTNNDLPNLGNINKSAISSKNINTQHIINSTDTNALSLVRTTHYLYFTTYINTSFILKTEITRNYFTNPQYDSERNETSHTNSSDTYIKYFNGSELVDVESYINYGTDGISKVYGEDNGGWGRCLSADDSTALKINLDGTIGNPTTSGGIEVPILVRRTPLLQPELVLENIENNNYNPLAKIINITTKGNKHEFKFDLNGVDKYPEEYSMTVCYPFIPENNTYYTRNPNGGRNGVIYDNYQLDLDTDPYTNIDSDFGINKQKQNLDFLGGYGICTGYTVILVPNNINISNAVKQNIFTWKEINQYFKDIKKKNNELYGRLEYFKLPANFYSKKDILNLQSIDKDSDNNSIVKPVLIAYNYQPESINSYLEDGITNNYNISGNNVTVKGRNFQTIKINARNLTEGKVWFGNSSTASNNIYINNESSKFNLYNHDNTIKSGVIYDMLIIPVYSDNITKDYDFISNNSGEINGVKYGGDEDDNNVIFSGSNPLVLNNYFAVGWIYVPTPIPDPDPDPVPPPTDKIYDTDACIVFPNVDIETYNLKDGIINESPGFWLNNTFRLILRMPCFRTNTTRLWNSDTYTVENMSNNSENVGHDTNKFLFSDIQIHVGKLNDDDLGLDKIDDTNLLICGDTDQHKMNRITHHIYSYKDFPSLFSKKLYNDDGNLELLTAGSLYPSKDDSINNYKNRFIEVNLSLLDELLENEGYDNRYSFKTNYSEGYYIQFRWKSQYATGTDTSGWSGWCGGSCDGGLKWWQSSEGNNIDNNIDNKGCGYFVPVRNYTQIHTDFRNYIKESYPGSLIKSVFDEQLDTTLSENIDNDTLNDKYTFIKGEIGKGSRMSHGDTDNNSKTKPKNAINRKYHINGNGNKNNTNIVPTYITDNNSLKHIISDINFNDLNKYKNNHDKNFNINQSILNDNQYMWEMLYLDYIISNMCKLYFKYRYNEANDSESFNSNGNKLYYGCQLPKEISPLDWECPGWSSTELTLKDARSYNSQINAIDRQTVNINNHGNTYDLGFNINKYYKKVITKNDFDELNTHLEKLLTYIKNPNLCGYTSENYNQIYPNGIKDIIPISNEYIIFEKHRKDIIGNDSIGSIGQSKTNNLYQLLIKNNYLKNIYNNIKAVCSPNEIGNKDIEVDD